MAIAFRSSDTNEVTGTAGPTNSVPAGTVNGDFLLWVAASTSPTPPAGPPAGWNLLTIDSGTSSSLQVYYRIASSEPASYTGDLFSGAGRTACIMACYTGVDPINPIDVAMASSIAGTTSFSTLAITPLNTGAWVIGIVEATIATGISGAVLTSSNLDAVDTQMVSTSGTASNSSGGIGHFAWTSGAFTPAWACSVATTRTLGNRLSLKPQGGGGGGGGASSMTFTKTVNIG